MSKKENRLIGINTLVIACTFMLFVVALLVKGFTHDLLLEAAVFLVSVKLILATFQIQILTQKIDKRMDDLEELIDKQNHR